MKDKKKIGIGELNYIGEDGKTKQYIFVLPQLDKLPRDIYANQVTITNSPTEFTLLFTRIQPPIKENQFPEGNLIETNVVAKIVLPIPIVEPFINALQENWDNFKKLFKVEKK